MKCRISAEVPLGYLHLKEAILWCVCVWGGGVNADIIMLFSTWWFSSGYLLLLIADLKGKMSTLQSEYKETEEAVVCD